MYTYLAMFLGSSLCPKQGVSSGHRGGLGTRLMYTVCKLFDGDVYNQGRQFHLEPLLRTPQPLRTSCLMRAKQTKSETQV